MSEDEVNLLGLVSERDIVHALGVYGARTLDLRASDIMTLVIYAAAGVGFGMRISLLTTIPADLFAGRSFGAILGFTNGGGGLGGFIGPFLAAYLFDHIGDYQLAFTVSALAIAGSAVAVWVAGPRNAQTFRQPVAD